MGTKNNPSAFDCFANAEPDEELFTLLGRDRHAPFLVLVWAELREVEGERREVVDEARECARQMIEFRMARKLGHALTGLRHDEMVTDRFNNLAAVAAAFVRLNPDTEQGLPRQPWRDE